jgi:hypothetical protein
MAVVRDRPAPAVGDIRNLVMIGFALRGLVGLLTPVPAEDGVNYLWMAQRFAEGDAAAALSEVFPPGLPLLLAPFVALGADPFRTAQIVQAFFGALALWPCVRIAQLVAPSHAMSVGWLLALLPLGVRFCGEIYTEPVFATLVATGLLAFLRDRPLVGGVFASVAFLFRPEAIALSLAGLVQSGWRGLRGVVPLLLVAPLLAWWRSSNGRPFELLPKLDFNAARGDAAWSFDGLHVDRVFDNVIALPGAMLEAWWGVFLLGIWGVIVGRGDRRIRTATVVLIVATAGVLLFLTRRRFFVGWYPLLAVMVPHAFQAMRTRAHYPLMCASVVVMLLGCLRIDHGYRHGEVVIGTWVGSMLRDGQTVSGDLTRVLWFAGQRPLAPRHFRAEELIQMASAENVRFVVLGERRATTAAVLEGLADRFERTGMPERERRAAELRGIVVLERKRP